MRYWLIANAQAGNGQHGQAFWLKHLQRAGLSELTVRDLADTAWEREVEAGDRVLVAGGDGSVNRAAACCVSRGATLGILPSGTANDFARNFALPADPDALCRLMSTDHTLEVDIAWLNDQLFLNVAHLGLGTLPSREASSNHKKRFGRFSYLAVLAQKIGLQRGFSARLHHDEGVIDGHWLSIAFASGAFFGGGQRIQEATLDDGKLNIVAIHPRPWLQLLWTFVLVRLLRRHPRHNGTVVHLKTRRCRIELRHERTVTADGETFGKVVDATVATQPGGLRVLADRLVPPG